MVRITVNVQEKDGLREALVIVRVHVFYGACMFAESSPPQHVQVLTLHQTMDTVQEILPNIACC